VTQSLIAVFHKYVFYRHTSRWVKLIFGFIRRILHCVVRKFGYLRNKDTSLWSFVLCVIVLYLIFLSVVLVWLHFVRNKLHIAGDARGPIYKISYDNLTIFLR